MFDLDGYDVDDKVKLIDFWINLGKWRRWYSAKDNHSICHQINTMMWYDAIFRIINEARRIREVEQSKETGFNGMVVDLFDRGFVLSQVLAIRRLIDKYSHRNPEEAVVSLVRLIKEIENEIELFSRENYVCFDGVPFSKMACNGDTLAFDKCIRRHEMFDVLSGVNAGKRCRGDKLNRSVLEKAREELKKCESIREYSHKFIAHASDWATRPKMCKEQTAVTLNQLDKCYKAIYRVATLIGCGILQDGPVGGIPIPPPGYLEKLDKPMVLKSTIPILDEHWRQRMLVVDDWDRFVWQDWVNPI